MFDRISLEVKKCWHSIWIFYLVDANRKQTHQHSILLKRFCESLNVKRFHFFLTSIAKYLSWKPSPQTWKFTQKQQQHPRKLFKAEIKHKSNWNYFFHLFSWPRRANLFHWSFLPSNVLLMLQKTGERNRINGTVGGCAKPREIYGKSEILEGRSRLRNPGNDSFSLLTSLWNMNRKGFWRVYDANFSCESPKLGKVLF